MCLSWAQGISASYTQHCWWIWEWWNTLPIGIRAGFLPPKKQYFLNQDFLALLGWQSWMQTSAQHLDFQVACLETPEIPKNKSTKFVCHRLSICKKDIHQQRQETMFNLIVQERPAVISQSKLGLGQLIFDQPGNDLTHCPGLASGTGVAGAGAGAGTAGLDAASAPSTAPLDSS